MRTLRLLLLLALGLTTLAAAEPRLRIGVESADQPISFIDAQGRPTGFTTELLEEMRLTGFAPFEIVPGPWTHLIRDFTAGKIDVLANVARTDDRLRDMDFSISHAFVHGLIFSRRDRPAILTTADFAGKTISTLQGSIAHTNALAHGGWGATILPFTDPQAALDATARGECDGVLLIYGLEGKYVTNTHGLRRGFVDDILHEFRFAVRKGDSVTLARLNDALATVRHNGAFDRLYDKWIGPIEPHPIRLSDLRPYTRHIVLGVLAIAAIIWWQRHMLARAARQARALQESEERFHGLVDSAFQGWVIHQEGRIVMANTAYASTFGYTPETLVGKPILDLTPPEAHAAVTAAMASDLTTPRETLGLRRDGTTIPIATSGRACTFAGKPARIAAVRDLTAEKQAVADQLVLSKLESTGILAGGIAHDFNNLLATMVLNVDLALLARLDPTSAAEAPRYLAAAKHAALSAKALTQQLITFAHGGASVRQPTDLAALLHQLVPLSLSGSNVRAEITAPPDLPRVEVDLTQIERAIGNLVLNAREAMPDGGVLTLRLDVADRGRGIPADLLPKIFDPYFSTKQRGTQKGMGLGLTISHSIAHQHGGALTVESRPDHGTTFRLYLPTTRLAAASLPAAPTAPAAPAPAPARPARVLVMDDEAALRETVQLALEHAGYSVDVAPEGGAAIALYRQAHAAGQPYDAVLLDLTVRGGMGGLETLSALRAADPAVKALVMSGYAHEAVLRDYASHGFRAAIAKPFDLASLRAAITRTIG